MARHLSTCREHAVVTRDAASNQAAGSCTESFTTALNKLIAEANGAGQAFDTTNGLQLSQDFLRYLFCFLQRHYFIRHSANADGDE
jgi:hypothetical protein